jgi:hypothetical protein
MPTAPKPSRDSSAGAAKAAKSGQPAPKESQERQERLAQALRDNLKKRKAQQRQRQGGPSGGQA